MSDSKDKKSEKVILKLRGELGYTRTQRLSREKAVKVLSDWSDGEDRFGYIDEENDISTSKSEEEKIRDMYFNGNF